MFTQNLMEAMEKPFQERLRRMGKTGECGRKAAQVLRLLQDTSEARGGPEKTICDTGGIREAQALKCLYASMPLSDAVDYPVELFQAYARHGVFLWEKGPFAGRVPERLFAGYVLHHRVNNENLTEHREFFYNALKDRIARLDMRGAVREANYWCASQAAYRATDERTASPMCVYRSAFGRCGEESTFTVSVLRSIGIPARQVYAPWWSHCDDNHAWVEAWCDGEWVFLGACEPEETLNTGWFVGASSRAMLVHSRFFLPMAEEDGAPEAMPGKDMCTVMNRTERYAQTVGLEVAVRDREGRQMPGANVSFRVVNQAHFSEIASLQTDPEGRCRLLTGKGTLHIAAYRDGAYGEGFVDTGKGEICTIVLEPVEKSPGSRRPARAKGESRQRDWEDRVILAPKDWDKNRILQTPEAKLRGRNRLKEMNALRREKENGFYDEALAERAMAQTETDERDRCISIMGKACGNQKEIADFLGKPTDGAYPSRWKLAVLESLREKDYRDVTAQILEENCVQTAVWDGTYEDSLLVPYILCPRVGNEMLRPFRGFIRGWLEEESRRCGRSLASEVRRVPSAAWRLAKEKIASDPRVEYGDLVTSARGALESGCGSELTRRTVCVQILRTLGIPARLNPAEGVPEAWEGERFVPVEGSPRTCRLFVSGQKDVEWNYFGNWTLARFAEEGYRTLMPGWAEGEMSGGPVSIVPGKYRILTTNRLPNGNLLAKQMFFELTDGEELEIHLELADGDCADLLAAYDIADFALRGENGIKCLISDLVSERGGLFIWLGEGEEPTEHILNEIYERKEAYGGLKTGVYFIAPGSRIKENPACRRVLKAVPGIRLLYDDFGEAMETLARRMYLEPGKLPLAVIVNCAMEGVYGTAGYNVGTGDMILKLLNIGHFGDRPLPPQK